MGSSALPARSGFSSLREKLKSSRRQEVLSKEAASASEEPISSSLQSILGAVETAYAAVASRTLGWLQSLEDARVALSRGDNEIR